MTAAAYTLVVLLFRTPWVETTQRAPTSNCFELLFIKCHKLFLNVILKQTRFLVEIVKVAVIIDAATVRGTCSPGREARPKLCLGTRVTEMVGVVGER